MGRIYDEFMHAIYIRVWDLREFVLSVTHFCFLKLSPINELCFGLLGRNNPGVCILAGKCSLKSFILFCEENYYDKLILNKV